MAAGWPRGGQFELKHVHSELPSGLFLKASKASATALGLNGEPDVERGGSKRRRLSGVTVSFTNKSSGALVVDGKVTASFELKYGQDDGSVMECFDLERAGSQLEAAGTILAKMQLGRTGAADQKAFAAVSGAYRASAAKRGKTRHVGVGAVFKTALTDFDLSAGRIPPISSAADLAKCVAQYTSGREQFAKVNSELKEVKRAIEELGNRWRAENGAAKEATAKEIKQIYREHDEVYAERFDYCKQVQDFLTKLRERITAYQDSVS